MTGSLLILAVHRSSRGYRLYIAIVLEGSWFPVKDRNFFVGKGDVGDAGEGYGRKVVQLIWKAAV